MNYEKAYEKAVAQLHPGERELTAVKTSLWEGDRFPGALVMTDQRLIFVGRGIGALKTRSLMLDAITSVDSDAAHMLFRTTAITVAGATHAFSRLPDAFLSYVAEVLAWRKGQHGQAQPVAPATPTSRVDQLERLAKLRDSGVLSDQEFAAEKSRLLG